ncbi:hypothetical protein P0082_09690 [Candidatus Haliotispira prima]|uniref:Uncharacterized protein n=1 Tax=Candidatus Haliotispira prima TaxID=3034016 RepID=A0ABY8MFJ0_9SPIO|nr:hypothetical protein P0082_09690 [Candidatus Haliotispira prima]
MVSSVQLEMSSTLALANIGAVVRLATEAAPTKAEAEANAGYVSLNITTNSTRKFSISQHYGSNFGDGGLTLADVLAPETQYKLYLFFEANTVNPIEGTTLTDDVPTLSFTTVALPLPGDTVWDDAWTNGQFVGGPADWAYSENQKGVFVAYTKVNTSLASFTLTSRTIDNATLRTLGTSSLGLVAAGTGLLFGFSKLGSSYPGYPDADNYHYIISTGDTTKVSGKTIQGEIFNGSTTFKLRVPLTRYGSP